MTLALAWTRKAGSVEELVVASDSRLRFGQSWDCCPKILSLPRSDSLICFAGDTMYTYPLMLQMAAAIEHYPRSKSRATDLTRMKGHTLRVFNEMLDDIHDLPVGEDLDPPDAHFILGGYSWEYGKFHIWYLHYDTHIGRFTFRPASQWRGVRGSKKIMAAGDHLQEFKTRLIALLRERRKLTVGGFDMEPFEVLRDMIRDEEYDSIGGPPQIMKVYQHLNTQPLAVYWPNREVGKITLLGRPLLSYETTRYYVLDPDAMTAHQTWRFT